MRKLAMVAAALAVSLAAAVDHKPPPVNDPFLDNLLGHWNISRKVHGSTVANTMDAEWVVQHRFLQLHMKDVANPPKYEALVLIGYDGVAERYVAYWMDDFGGAYSAVGRGRRQGNTIEFQFEYPDGPFFNTFYWQPNEAGWKMVLESSKDGKRELFAEDTVRRK
jgi:hypothetical protein